MGKKSQPKPPPAPDPYAVAGAQTTSNINTAVANSWLGNANEVSDLGSVKYEQTGSTMVGDQSIPTFTRTTTMAPEQKKLYDQQVELGSKLNTAAGQQIDKISGVLNTPLTEEGLPQEAGDLGAYKPGLYGLTDMSSGIKGDFADVGQLDRDVEMDMASKTFGNGNDFSEDRKRVEEAMYARLNPELERSRAGLETQLVNQGLTRGSQAFNEAMDEARRAENDARIGVTLAGGQEQSRLFGMDLQRGQFANQATAQNNAARLSRGTFRNASQQQAYDQERDRTQFGNDAVQTRYGMQKDVTAFNNARNQQDFGNQQTIEQHRGTTRDRALQERIALRNQPINEISALMSGGQVSMPQFAQYKGGNVEATPVGQYVYNNAAIANDQWKTQSNQAASTRNGLYNLAGTALSAGITKWSDRRLKTNVVRIGQLASGLATYAYDYVWGGPRQVGVMADEALAIAPHAVSISKDGYMAVDYGKL